MNFDIFEIYLFNKSGALIAENIIENTIYNQYYYKKVFPHLIKSTSLYDKKKNNLINHNIYFLKQRKIVTLNIATANVISLAVCTTETKSKLVYFFLLKIIMSYLNYMKMHNCNTTYNMHSIIYETIFLSPIKYHYSLAIKEVFRRYTLYINNILYKNFYLINLCSNDIILSLEAIFDLNKNGYMEKKIPNKLIWNEILFHAHKLQDDYIKKNNYIFQIENLQEFYTKVEIKATYPRLIYIIKFLPLLGGLALVYEYSQNSMSRIGGLDQSIYKEYNIEYGYTFDEENNFKTKNDDEFLLNEPDVLIHIHFYIIECLLCNLDNIKFFVFNKYQKIYISDEILQFINKHIYSNINISQITDVVNKQEFVHQLLEKIISELYDEYLQINSQKEQAKFSSMINKTEKAEVSLNKLFFLSYPDSLYISKKFTLNTLFQTGQLDQLINPNDISLNLSSEEETSFTDDIYQTLRDKNQFNSYNDPYFYYRFHYANASKESQRLMDLLYDNVTLNENQILFNPGKNNKNLVNLDQNELMSLNNTDISNRQIKGQNDLNPYLINNFNAKNNPNISSNSSQITPLLPKMNRK